MAGFFAPSKLQRRKAPSGIAKCGACGLYKHCQSPKMAPHGLGKAGVLVLGEAPGANEDRAGRPFVGDAGKHLRQMLRSIGVDLDRDAWVTNAVICRPPKNATPDESKVGYCHPNLAATLRRLQPRVVVTLGRVPLSAMLRGVWDSDVGQLGRWVGYQIPFPSFWVCPTWHPSYLMREGDEMLDRNATDHLEAAFALTETPPRQPNWNRRVLVELDDGNVEQVLRRMCKARRPVAFDYECNCLKPDWEESRIYTCAVSDGASTIAYPWTKRARAATYALIRDPRVPKIAANMKFEERWTRKEFRGRGVLGWRWDTMLAAHCLDNRPGTKSLKFQAFVRLGVQSWDASIRPYLEQRGRSHYNAIAQAPLRDLLFYNGMDGLQEHRLAYWQAALMGGALE